MDEILLKTLKNVDTPTVCNAIEAAQGKRGFNGFTKGTMVSSSPQAGAVVGYALTAKIAAKAPPEEPQEVIKKRRMAYYRYIAEARKPAITVIEDCDYPDSVGAFWGEINTTVHKGLGVSGALTNGVVRDLGDVPADFPVIAGSIGPSHAFVHIREIGTPVEIMGLSVREGDMIHADRHGALVIPADVLPLLSAAIKTLIDTEQLILSPAQSPDFDYETFERAWAAFEAART